MEFKQREVQKGQNKLILMTYIFNFFAWGCKFLRDQSALFLTALIQNVEIQQAQVEAQQNHLYYLKMTFFDPYLYQLKFNMKSI